METKGLQGFRFGIEHEFPLLRGGEFADFGNTTFEDLDRIVEGLPVFEADYPGLRVGDLGIKKKRWYIEGFERFSEEGSYLRTDIKGMELRTPICESVDEAVATLESDFATFRAEASKSGFAACAVAYNPFRTEFVPVPPLNQWEVAHRKTPEERTAFMHMLTYGPDVSLSHPDFDTDRVIDAARKLTYYSPFIVPWSFSSPFCEGKLWSGLSRRTFYRTGARPAALAFVSDESKLMDTVPTLTELARIPAEGGRIEFKAFDTLRDVAMYGDLLSLVLGLVLDETLPGRLDTPDAALHQLSAREGFGSITIRNGAEEALSAARRALGSEAGRLDALASMLHENRTSAHDMIERYESGHGIMRILNEHYGDKI